MDHIVHPSFPLASANTFCPKPFGLSNYRGNTGKERGGGRQGGGGRMHAARSQVHSHLQPQVSFGSDCRAVYVSLGGGGGRGERGGSGERG